ncbi:ubiquitin carboxyl-terminal hydrolase 47-like isoform 2-T2 [Pangshura tecta]
MHVSCFCHSATHSLLLYHRVYSDDRPSKPAGPSAESMGNFDTGDTSNQGASPARENEMSWAMENAAMQEGGSPASSRSASPVQLPSDPRKGNYMGLRNQGSTCYLNSLLQCLFFTQELREVILSCDNCDSGIMYQLKKLFQKLKHNKSAPSTKGITKCLGVRNVHQQQDVVTYFRILMNKIVEEKEEIQLLYHVKMVHSITCHGCGQQTRIQQNPVLSLALSLDEYNSNSEVYSVHNALDAVQKVSEFIGDERFYCETCRSKQLATSRCYFQTLPQILVLNLKRYQFDVDQFKKLRYEVSVPFSLTVNSEEQPNTQYELFAICHHSGGIYGGHYVAEIKSFENDCWYSFDDTTVNKVQEEWDTSAKKSSTAYLLMYRKAACDAKPTEVLFRVPNDDYLHIYCSGLSLLWIFS